MHSTHCYNDISVPVMVWECRCGGRLRQAKLKGTKHIIVDYSESGDWRSALWSYGLWQGVLSSHGVMPEQIVELMHGTAG